MKLLKILIPIVALAAGALIVTTPSVSCTKKIIHDTTIVTDTITIHDTVGCCNINSDMIAYYTFTNGSLKDSSGYHNDIVFNNATPTTDRFGNANGAYLFNGSTSYMKVLNSTSLNPSPAITMAAMVKLNGFYTGLCHSNQIFGKVSVQDYINGFYAMRVGDYHSDCSSPVDVNYETFGAGYGDNVNHNAAGAGPDSVYAKTGRWYTLVYTYDGSVANFYIDGVLKNSRTVSTTFTPNSYDLYIGKVDSDQWPYWWNGVIDEIRIYNKALCPTAVKQLSNLKSNAAL